MGAKFERAVITGDRFKLGSDITFCMGERGMPDPILGADSLRTRVSGVCRVLSRRGILWG